MIVTFGSLFSGGGGADLGLMDAGLSPLWAVEADPQVASVYRRNLETHVMVADVCDVRYGDLPRVDLLWASPVCKRFSTANSKRGETGVDFRCAGAVCDALRSLRPAWFAMEQVPQYDDSHSFRLICRVLDRLGYWYEWRNVNAADYGVPQTRRRMILRASLRGMFCSLPPPQTHIGWYEAIEDLLPSLPESKFAPWQLARLPEEIKTLLVGVNGENGAGYRLPQEPAPTLTTDPNQLRQRAFLLMTGNTQIAHPTGTGIKESTQPEGCVLKNSLRGTRAILCGSQSLGEQGYRPALSPAPTLTAKGGAAEYRAFLLSGANGGEAHGYTAHPGGDPAFAVTASADRTPMRASLPCGRVVAMTPRALARFQSFPDTYWLPEGKKLACTVIGNAVPPLLAKAVGLSLVVETLTEAAA